MAAGGDRHRRAARPRRRPRRPLRVRQLDHGLRPVLERRGPVDGGPADRPRAAPGPTADSRRWPRRRCSIAIAPTGFPVSVVRPAAIYGPRNNIYDMETPMFLRLAAGSPDPAAAQRAGHRVVRPRRRPVRTDGRHDRGRRGDRRGVQRDRRGRDDAPVRRRAGRRSSASSPTSSTSPMRRWPTCRRASSVTSSAGATTPC